MRDESSTAIETEGQFKPGALVRARGREWVVLPEMRNDLLKLRPLGGAEDDATLIYLPLEPERPVPATFGLPNPDKPGSQQSALLLRDALLLKLRAGAGPFRSFGNINFVPRAYQLAPLLLALKLDTIRLLIADDVGIGKTIEAGLIVRELLDRGETERFTVICPPHLCEQWQRELSEKFSIEAEVVRTGTVARLERDLRPDESIFEVYPHTIVSLDYIKSDRRRDEFLRVCPNFVVVDEAHTCVSSNTNTRHQRYRLLKSLAESEPGRNMLFLTATPHSGDETAFHNLLGLLDTKFLQLADHPTTKDDERQALRSELANHLVQRRRMDIAEWKDATGFPVRESKEVTYKLKDDWGNIFTDVLKYARDMVRRTEGGTKLQQRMSWWAALALLRCISSSPAAASLALRTRLQATEGKLEREQIEEMDQIAGETIMDHVADDSLTLSESVPAGTIEVPEDVLILRQLIERTDALRGPGHDPKLKTLVREVRKLVSSGFRPVVFCRYIATAHYVGEELKHALSPKKTRVAVVTGELTSDQREEQVENMGEIEEDITPVLVATDCLSEGINLQNYFNSVVHYDLAWNPTRHEQREGRADRFGQGSAIVRALMLYGEDNPVDGAVLRVILRKAENIRKELGVAVPLPADNSKILEAIMKAVIINPQIIPADLLDLEDTDTEVEDVWRSAQDEVRRTRTVFAQQRLKPEDVLPEWEKTLSVLGGEEDVVRFVRLCAQRLRAPLTQYDGYSRIPATHLPKPLQDRLEGIGFKSATKISFSQPCPTGAVYIHRAHPLVSTLADYVAEQTLENDDAEIGARAGAIFTEKVRLKTTLYLLRLRSQIQVETRGEDRRFRLSKSLLTEECVGVAVRGDEVAEVLTGDEALSLLSLEPSRNMEDGQKTHLVRQALGTVSSLETTFANIAKKRSEELLADHRRIRDASDARGMRYAVVPALPVDKIGIYVFMPATRI